MKKLVMPLLAVGVAVGLFCPQSAFATVSQATNAPARTPLPGEQIAQTVSLITGVAISPLFGVGTVGAWQYCRAETAADRARLPWFANPWFWAPALTLVILCFIKDTVGTAMPTALKKPFDVAEAIENKISGLIAVGAFVPVVASIFEMRGGDGALLGASSLGLAAVDLSWLANAAMVGACVIAFVVVFLASHAINVLILLSPFTTVDAALKGFRFLMLSSVVATAFANPWLGAVWALVIIVISYLVAGWSFRLSHLGLAFVWDFVTGRRGRFKPDKAANKMFLSRRINEAPARTYGRLARDDQGRLVFHYRPWLVLPARSLVLPEGKYEAGRGVFYSELLHVEGNAAKTLILLPPRYLGHEDELVIIYKLAGTREVGLRATFKWLKSILGDKVQTVNGLKS
jgi:hypothetical protein